MPCDRPSPFRCERNHNQSTVQLEGSCYQFSPAAQGDCWRYHHHYLFRFHSPNRNDMEMSVVTNLKGKNAKMKINEFHVQRFLILSERSSQSHYVGLHSKLNIQKRISNEVNRLRLKDSALTFSRDNLKQIAPHKNQH